MTELRQEIARVLAESLTSTAPDCPHGCRIGGVTPDNHIRISGHVDLNGLATALLPLISKAEQRGAWQSIETAPKDGRTEIIGRDAAGRVRRTWYFAPSSRTQQWVRFEDNVPWKPIHWMPLPPLPTEEE